MIGLAEESMNVPAVINDTEEKIENLIHIVRGEQVMLDSDLAMLYNVETKRLNESVKRNLKRFPKNFCFQLTEEEHIALRSQFATSNIEPENASSKGGRRYLPYVFTEQGIAMLSAVLRSDEAIQVSLNIMNTFVKMRKFLAENALMFERLSSLELKQLQYQKESNEKFDKIFAYISEHEEANQHIFFDGQIYDAFSLLVSLIERAEKSIVLIDNYVDVGTLNILAKKREGVNVTIYTVRRTRLAAQDIDNFNAQYPVLKVNYAGVFHDRFLIIDETAAYHIGASIKDAGKKCFGINLIEDIGIITDILQRLEIEMEEANS
ncbi:MAG: ORF6N domain-containing protein [Lachnospiraceae bacterium]|nr:ORF6N domain-containing protein [Lachnospiraceae bacterium]